MRTSKLTAIFLTAFAVAAQAATYIITGSGTSFTATKGETTVGTANQPIQAVIDAITADAIGTASTIQFGDGTETLDIGANSISLDGGCVLCEDFEGENSFNVVNGSQTNKWVVGTATAAAGGGTKSAYISNNGTSNAYTLTSKSVVHLYKDVTFPAGSGSHTLTFDWKGQGESSYDDLRVFLVATSVTPAAGTELSETLLGTYGGQGGWQKATIAIPAANNGTTKRLVFSWRNDNSAGTQPPIAVDNIAIIGTPSVTLTGKLTFSNTRSNAGIILGNGISVNSTADIVGTSDGVVIENKGTLTISDGTVQSEYGDAIENLYSGSVTIISGGTVRAAKNYSNAVYNYGGSVTITGGTVQATGENGIAVYNSSGSVTISGGTVQATGEHGYAVAGGGSLVLSSSPDIIGIIRTPLGTLSIAEDFAPASKTYAIAPSSAYMSAIAVANGKNYLSNFVLQNASCYALAASGEHIVIEYNVSPSCPAPSTYVITGSGTSFTATKGETTVGTANQPIQTIIDAIKTDAAGAPCTIQFENLTNTLDIGTANITFDGGTGSTGGTDWGLITLAGKITSSVSSSYEGTISLKSGASIASTADIANTAESNGIAVYSRYYSGAGSIIINGGTISATTKYAIDNSDGSGSVIISGGKVQATTGDAIHNSGSTTISGGEVSVTTGSAIGNSGSVTISGGKVQATGGGYAIRNFGSVTINGGEVSATTVSAIDNPANGSVTISGGKVSATTGKAINNGDYFYGEKSIVGSVTISGGEVSATTGDAVYNDYGSVTISGGKVLATEGYALSSRNGTTTTTLTGGLLFAYGTGEANVIYGNYTTTTGNALILAWNKTAGRTLYIALASNDIFKKPGTATATWLNQNGKSGIDYANGTNAGFVEIDGVEVKTAEELFGNPASATYSPTLKLGDVSLPSDYAWKTPTTALNAGNGQSFAATYTEPGKNSVEGNIVVNVAKASGATLSAPALASKTYNSLSVAAVVASTGQSVEYGISTTPADATATWQANLTFTELDPETTYYIFARALENSNYNTGAISEALSAETQKTPSLTGITGEPWHNFIVKIGIKLSDGTYDYPNVQISNLNNPVNADAYIVELKDVLIDIGELWRGYWAQASIGLKAQNNGVLYDLAQCKDGFRYKYKGLKHRFSLQSERAGLEVTHYTDFEYASDWTEAVVIPNTLQRDDYDEAYSKYPNIPLNLSNVKDIHWTVRPYDGVWDFIYGDLQIKDFECLGTLVIYGSAEEKTCIDAGKAWENGECKATTIALPQTANNRNILAHTTANAILLENLPANAKVEVYNLQGKRMYSTTSHSPLATSHLKIGVPTGMYIVKINTQTLRVSVK